MTILRGLLLLALGAAAAVSADRLLVRPSGTTPGAPAPVTQAEPRPGDPPVVWIDGVIEGISDSSLKIQEGEGRAIEVERFAGGATTFLRPVGDKWVEVSGEDTAAGEDACVEALLDGSQFLALQVFLGAACGPAAG